MVRKQEFSILICFLVQLSVHVGLHSCHFLYLHLNVVLHTDHLILYCTTVASHSIISPESCMAVNFIIQITIPKNGIYCLLALGPTEYYLDSYTMLLRNLNGFVRRLLSGYIDFCIPLKMASKGTVDTPSRFAIEISDCDLQKVHF